MRTHIVWLLVAIGLATGPVVFAEGSKVSVDVSIVKDSSTPNSPILIASGSLGSARAEGSPPKDIGCSLETDMTSLIARCWAESPTGVQTYLTCYTPNTRFIQAVTSIHGGSFISFSVDSGTCKAIVVQNGSQYMPMQP